MRLHVTLLWYGISVAFGAALASSSGVRQAQRLSRRLDPPPKSSPAGDSSEAADSGVKREEMFKQARATECTECVKACLSIIPGNARDYKKRPELCVATCTTALTRLLESIRGPGSEIPGDADNIVEVMLKTMDNNWPPGMTAEEADKALSGNPGFQCHAADGPADYFKRYHDVIEKRLKLRLQQDSSQPVEQPKTGDVNGQKSQLGTSFMRNMWRSIKHNFLPSESSTLRRFGGQGRPAPRLIRPVPY